MNKLKKLVYLKKTKLFVFQLDQEFMFENFEVSMNVNINKQLNGMKILANKGYNARFSKKKKQLNFTNQNIIDFAFSNIR